MILTSLPPSVIVNNFDWMLDPPEDDLDPRTREEAELEDAEEAYQIYLDVREEQGSFEPCLTFEEFRAGGKTEPAPAPQALDGQNDEDIPF